MHTLFGRLKLKEKPILSYSSATDDELHEFASILRTIEPDLSSINLTRKDLSKLPHLSEFNSHCCYQRKYVFGVKKCGKYDCKWCTGPQLPQEVFEQLHHIPDPIPSDDPQHYKAFGDLYGTLTTDHLSKEITKPAMKCRSILVLKLPELLFCVESVYGQEFFMLNEN